MFFFMGIAIVNRYFLVRRYWGEVSIDIPAYLRLFAFRFHSSLIQPNISFTIPKNTKSDTPPISRASYVDIIHRLKLHVTFFTY